MKAEELVHIIENDHKWIIEHLFFIRNKPGDVVPALFNPMWNKLWAEMTTNDVVGKAGQVRSTTFWLLRMLKDLLLNPHRTGLILCQDEDPYGKLQIERLHFTYDRIPSIEVEGKLVDIRDMKGSGNVKLLTDNSLLLRFPNGSQVLAGSADAVTLGRSQPYHYILSTESEFNKDQTAAELVLAAAEARRPPGIGWRVRETTARGEGSGFHKEFMQAWTQPQSTPVKAHFFGWWWDEELFLRGDESNLLASARMSDEEIKNSLTSAEISGMLDYGWTIRQIRWRRNAVDQPGFDQEHAEDPLTMFKSTGQRVFDIKKIEQTIKPMIRDAVIVEDSGCLLFWQPPRPEQSYLLVADPAGGHPESHPSAAVIVNFRGGIMTHHATLRGRWSIEVFARKCFNLAERYNNAKIGFDRTGGYGEGFYAAMTLMGVQDSRFVRHKNPMKPNAKAEIGIPISWRSKGVIIDHFSKLLMADGLYTPSLNAYAEMQGYRQNGVKFEPSPGGTDDELDCLMLGNECTEFVSMGDFYRTPVIIRR